MTKFFNSSFFRYLPIIIAISCFFPAIGSLPVRVEHFVIYIGFLVILLCFVFEKTYPLFDKRSYLLFFFVIGFIITKLYLWGDNLTDVTTEVASFENILAPTVIFFIVSVMLYQQKKSKVETIEYFLKTYIGLIILNTLFILYLCFSKNISVVKFFTGSRDLVEGLSLAERVVVHGRYSGVFNQPIESGLAYSIALIALFYLYFKNLMRKMYFLPLLVIVFIGGTYSISKVFLACTGLFGAMLIPFFITSKNQRVEIFKFSLKFLFAFIFSILFFIKFNPEGVVFIDEYYSPAVMRKNGLLLTITSNRYGARNAVVNKKIGEIKNIVTGDGFPEDRTYDNGFFEIWTTCGLMGLFAYLIFIMSYSYSGFKMLRQDRFLGYMLIFLSVFLVIGSLGAGTITLNRSGAVLTILLSMFSFMTISENETEKFS